ncbi:hypothetical protein NLG97_g8957 [Lecanicillium saksenae]|uniref:Uncharacterized protein n=1 Tax=Lecanicillium saksenae TaxID=468837 RepID=A0ACC1QK30_9HYPO|nr:hypothetical protein NLG97_g8957 [Lecanicillium saksenae]
MESVLPSGVKMRHPTAADIPAIVDVYMDSFINEIFSRQIFPRGVQSSMDYWTRTVEEEMEEEDAVWHIITEEVDGQETVQGFLKWTRPGAPFPEPDADGYPPEGQPAIAAEFYAKVMGAHHERMKDTPHWYLDMMGVRRACQGKGYAKAMVNWGVKQSEQDGCPLYVDATGDARTFYEKMGFKELGDLKIPTPQGDAEIYLMLRKP